VAQPFALFSEGWGGSVARAASLLSGGLFLSTSLGGGIPRMRSFPARRRPPFCWKFIAFHGVISFSCAFQNAQGFGPVRTAGPFAEVYLGTQSGDLFRHRNVDELVESYAFRFGSLAQLVKQRRL
jgi:hypothetical protein